MQEGMCIERDYTAVELFARVYEDLTSGEKHIVDSYLDGVRK